MDIQKFWTTEIPTNKNFQSWTSYGKSNRGKRQEEKCLEEIQNKSRICGGENYQIKVVFRRTYSQITRKQIKHISPAVQTICKTPNEGTIPNEMGRWFEKNCKTVLEMCCVKYTSLARMDALEGEERGEEE